MATEVTLMVLPGFAGDRRDTERSRPRIFLDHKGTWFDLSSQRTDVSKTRSEVEGELKDYMDTIDKQKPLKFPTRLKKIGLKILWDRLVPSGLQKVLQEAADTAAGDDVPILRIHTLEDWIPWECVHDGVDFLGLRFQIARLPIGPTVRDLGVGEPLKVYRIYNLLAKGLFDVKDDVKRQCLVQGWEKTFADLVDPPAQEVRIPAAAGTNGGYPSLADLEEAVDPDIMHITCHGGEVDKDNRVYWTLDHKAVQHQDYRIYCDDVETIARSTDFFAKARPLVFANACASDRAHTGSEDGSSGDLPKGFGSTFVAQGAAAFVGTVAPVSKGLSVEFACEFYKRLLGEGVAVGKALWATKDYFRKRGETDPSWLFYCLYGPPETRFQILK